MKTEKSNPKDVSPAISTYLIAYNSLQTIGLVNIFHRSLEECLILNLNQNFDYYIIFSRTE